MIYLFNSKYSFNRTGLDHLRKKKLALVLALFTLPYFFFVPTRTMYRNNGTNKIDSIYIEETNNYVELNNVHKDIKEAVKRVKNNFMDTYNKYIEYKIGNNRAIIIVTENKNTVYNQRKEFEEWSKEVVEQIKLKNTNLKLIKFIFSDASKSLITYNYNI